VEEEIKLTNIRNRIFFYLGFLVLIILMFVMIKPYITTIIISLISVVLLQPVYKFFIGLDIVKKRRPLAVSLTLLSFVLIIVVPIYVIVRMTTSQLSAAFAQIGAQEVETLLQSIGAMLEGVDPSGGAVEGTANILDTVQKVVLALGAALAGWVLDLASALPNLIVNLVIFIAVTASLLPVFDDLVELSQRFSPIGYDLGELYNRKITAMVKSLVTGVFLIAIIQGLMMGVVYWLAGMDYIFLLVIISMLLAIIPMVGISWLVIAIAVLSFIGGDSTQAIIVLIGFYGVVNWVDILLRPKFISKDAHLHTALFLLSIFAGLSWAGFMGLFYGPITMLLLVTTVDIYVENFAQEDGELIGSAVSSRIGGED
jgi:predicted PurR-regulated permease PerM